MHGTDMKKISMFISLRLTTVLILQTLLDEAWRGVYLMTLSNAKVILQGRHNAFRDSHVARACRRGIFLGGTKMTSHFHKRRG
jgi:hypothetical protein